MENKTEPLTNVEGTEQINDRRTEKKRIQRQVVPSGLQDSSLLFDSNPSFCLRLTFAIVEKGFRGIGGMVPEVDPKITTDVTELLIALSVSLAEHSGGVTSEAA